MLKQIMKSSNPHSSHSKQNLCVYLFLLLTKKRLHYWIFQGFFTKVITRCGSATPNLWTQPNNVGCYNQPALENIMTTTQPITDVALKICCVLSVVLNGYFECNTLSNIVD